MDTYNYYGKLIITNRYDLQLGVLIKRVEQRTSSDQLGVSSNRTQVSSSPIYVLVFGAVCILLCVTFYV